MDGDNIKGTWRDFLPVSAVLATGLTLALSAFLAVRGYYAALDQQQFRRNATYYSTSFQDDVERHVTSLAAIRAFVSASRGVTRWEFSAFAHQVLPQNSGFRAVLWVPVVSSHDRAPYEKQLQDDGLYGLRIREVTDQGQFIAAADRSAYLPVSYVEPFEGNGNLVGLDLSGNSLFAGLFHAAGESGRISASAPVSQALVTGLSGPAVLIAFPLHPVAVTPAAATQTPLQGYALGVLELDRIIAETIGSRAAPLQAAIAYRQTPQSPPALVGGAHPALDRWFGDAAFHQTMAFDIAGQHFILALRSASQGGVVTGLYVPLGASLLVIALTALLMQTMLSTTLRKRMVERAVILRTAELHAINQTLRDEVEQRRLAEAALRVARDRAEAANQAKSAFLATMSHELRTPLNAIIGFSGILAADQNCDTRALDYAQEIHVNGEHLLDLINDILDLTQMDHGESAGSEELIHLPDCVAAALVKSQPAANTRGISLKCALPEGLPLLHGDARRLQKAMLHLLSNAIKFTPRGGMAGIAARIVADGMLILQVSDNGAGMAPGAEKNILELFSQYDGRLARQHEGVGLGLTYVHRVADLHQAKLDISSTLGQGTRVSLIFPRHRVARRLEVA